MIEYKKIYYYVICLIVFFVFLWGAIDFASAGTSFLLNRHYEDPPTEGGAPLDEYYNRRMTSERISDGLVRIIICGVIFIYSRKKINQLEEA